LYQSISSYKNQKLRYGKALALLKLKEKWIMKVILVQDVEKLGKFGEVKDVSDGYARNYLIPKKFVLPYSKENLAYVENLKKDIDIKKQREKDFIVEQKHQLEKNTINISVNVGKDNKFYGSVTKEDIVEAIEQQLGIKVDKHSVILEQPIKELGIFNVLIKLHSSKFPDITETANVKIWVIGREKK